MKYVKRLFMLALVCVMLGSIIVIPASAVTSWRIADGFSQFDTVYYNNAYSDYTIVAQRFFQCYSNEYAMILKRAEKNNNKGVDGFFGQCTYDVATSYQGLKGLDPDGWIGPQTWAKIANDLKEETYGDFKELTRNGNIVVGVFMDGSIPSRFIYYDGNGGGGWPFHYYRMEVR